MDDWRIEVILRREKKRNGKLGRSCKNEKYGKLSGIRQVYTKTDIHNKKLVSFCFVFSYFDAWDLQKFHSSLLVITIMVYIIQSLLKLKLLAMVWFLNVVELVRGHVFGSSWLKEDWRRILQQPKVLFGDKEFWIKSAFFQQS